MWAHASKGDADGGDADGGDGGDEPDRHVLPVDYFIQADTLFLSLEQ